MPSPGKRFRDWTALALLLATIGCGPVSEGPRGVDDGRALFPGFGEFPGSGSDAAQRGSETTGILDFTPEATLDAATIAAHEAGLAEQSAQRKQAVFERYIDDPFPSPESEVASTRCWAYAGFILSAYRAGAQLDRADRYLREIRDDLGFAREGPADASPCYFALPLLVRVYFDPLAASHLTGEVRDILLEILHRYVDVRSRVATAAGSSWRIEMSENHDAIQKATFLLATRALMLAPAPYGEGLFLGDGHDVATHHQSWVSFWMRYFADRAREGIGCEIASPTYAKHTLASYLGVRDFSGDPDLAARSEDFLQLYWSDVAQDFLPAVGVRGGAETRTYKDANLKLGSRQSTRPAAYLYGWHDDSPAAIHPLTLIVAASNFMPSALVHAQATQKQEGFAYRARRCGRGSVTRIDDEPHYHMQFDEGRGSHLLRTSWVTDAYVIGALTFHPDEPYNALAGQNRAMGVSFASGVNDRIVVHGIGRDRDGTVGYDEITGITAEDVLMVARDPEYRRSAGLRIFVSQGALWDARVDVAGWWFSRTPSAYLAIRIPEGGYRVVEEKHGFMLEPEDSWTPIVIQLGRPDRDGSFEAFRARVLDNRYAQVREPLTITKRGLTSDDHERVASSVHYRSLSGDIISVWSHNKRVPQVNGRSVDLLPALTYDSPFIASRYRSDRVTLFHPDFGSRELDFSVTP